MVDPITPDALEEELERIKTLELRDLKSRFLEIRGVPLPKFMRAALARRAVAHVLRENIEGGLDRETQKRLDQLVSQIVPNGCAPPPKPNRKLRTGTRLVREWQGKVHEVAVTKEGLVWNGTSYSSLSSIATAITGTKWNGWVFFGVKKAGLQGSEVPTPHIRTRRGRIAASAQEAAHG